MSDDEIYDGAVAEAQVSGLMSGSIATDRCQCLTCGEVFTTESNFDRQMVPGRIADDFDGSWCHRRRLTVPARKRERRDPTTSAPQYQMQGVGR